MKNKKKLSIILIIIFLIVAAVIFNFKKNTMILGLKQNDKIQIDKNDEKKFMNHQEKIKKIVYLGITDTINNKILFSKTIDTLYNNNLYYIMDNFFKDRKIKYSIDEKNLHMMYNLAEGKTNSWVCYVNGKKYSSYLKDYWPKSGDKITWQYVDNR